MDIQKIDAARLNPAPYNPRRDLKPGDKDYEKLKRSMEQFGAVEPVVWNRQTGNVVGGHQRLKILLDMGETLIDCVVVDLDPPREKALNLALNRITGDWDEGKLAALMADLDASAFDVSLTGFDAEEIDALMNKFYSAEAAEDNFDADKAAADIEAAGGPTTKPGDLWQLGDHRLLCGDSASPEDMARLMGKDRAACAVTAPPETSGDYRKDGLDPWLEKMAAVARNLCNCADVICWNLSDLFATGSQFIEPTGFYSVKLFADCNYRPIWIRIWKKQGILARTGSAHLTSAKPTREYEYVAAFAGNEVDEYNDQEYTWISAFAAHSYRFTRRLTKEERRKWGYAGVWEIAAMPSSKGGPPLMPVELPWRCIKMHSDPGGIVLDPFAGAGATLIAAEQSGRGCYAMDADPLNCDLVILRWEQFTGEKVTLLEHF
jgi:ParB-like chromosome segregation protein Spo0J